MTVTSPLRYSPFDYQMHADPYPTYTRLRDEAPLYRNDEQGFWAISRHADVLQALRDTKTFSSAHGVSLEPSATGPHAYRVTSFLAQDPPRHDLVRAIVSKGFTPRRVAELEPWIKELTSRYIEPALDGEPFDFVGQLSGKLPMDVISEMIGVPASDRDEVRRLADRVMHRDDSMNDVPVASGEAAIEIGSYFMDMVRARREHPTEDLTSAVVHAVVEGERLSDGEVVGFLFLMVIAGNETTAKLLANAWYWAWRYPGQRAKVFGDPRLIPRWIEETLRFDSSTQVVARLVTRDVELHGQTIAEGDRLAIVLGSANRDDRVFADAQAYDIDRDTSDLISFGAGPHFCMGAALARLEARIVLNELVSRVKTYEVDEANASRTHSINVRGFSSLPTTVELI